MAIDCRGFNFPFGKFEPYPGCGMVYRLADYFNFGWSFYAEKEKRG